MQYIIYKNINANFTFENIYSHVNKYWTNEVINKKEYTKIWLTIIVFTKKNKKYKLINCLPFNTNNIWDILIVIKQNLNKISLCNRKDILQNITIKHRLDKNTYIPSKPSIFNIFKPWLLSYTYTNAEIKLANSIFNSNYSKKNIYNSNMDLNNSLKTKNLRQEYGALNFKKYNRNNLYVNKKGKHRF